MLSTLPKPDWAKCARSRTERTEFCLTITVTEQLHVRGTKSIGGRLGWLQELPHKMAWRDRAYDAYTISCIRKQSFLEYGLDQPSFTPERCN